MKNTSNFLLLSTILGGLLFSCLFWNERLALNLLIYSTYVILVSRFNPGVTKGPKFIFFAAAHLSAGILVVINNSSLTLVAYYLSMLLFIGFTHYKALQTIFAAGFAAVLQILTFPINFFLNLSGVNIGGFNLKPLLKVIKYALVPTFVVSLFTMIYSAANEVFAHYLESTFVQLLNWAAAFLELFFKNIDFARIAHFGFGTILTGGLLYTFFSRIIEKTESGCSDELTRVKKSKRHSLLSEIADIFIGSLLRKKLALKTEYITGVLSLGALNLLLLVVNSIDISTLWLGYKPTGNFSADLHQGTNALIFSIIMAMIVIIYFFRSNLNFYSKNKPLKMLAFVWVAQNMLLIISILIRDGYYIEYYGLTHKRIGVMIFALLCSIGLATVYIKVARQKTLFYLVKINGYLWFALLLILSTVNWDVLIVKYNLDHSDSITVDPDYLLSLSDKTLPLLDKNRSKLIHTKGRITDPYEIKSSSTNEALQQRLNKRIAYFTERYHRVSWLSWNVQDLKIAQHFRIRQQNQ